MDSLDKIIADMEEVHSLFLSEALDENNNLNIKLYYQGKSDTLIKYLTRLKALRELTDKKEDDESK